jgi:hypothetical protein
MLSGFDSTILTLFFRWGIPEPGFFYNSETLSGGTSSLRAQCWGRGGNPSCEVKLVSQSDPRALYIYHPPPDLALDDEGFNEFSEISKWPLCPLDLIIVPGKDTGPQ